MILRPCKFCGSYDVWLERFFTVGPAHYVICHHCAATGPLAATAKQAAELWNRAMPGDGDTDTETFDPETSASTP